jgi:hypothetical protein
MAKRNPGGMDPINLAIGAVGLLAAGGVVYAVAKPKATTGAAPGAPVAGCSPILGPLPNQSLGAASSDFIAHSYTGTPSAQSIAAFNALTPQCFASLNIGTQALLREAASVYTLAVIATKAFGPASAAAANVGTIAGPVPGSTATPAPPTGSTTSSSSPIQTAASALQGFTGIPGPLRAAARTSLGTMRHRSRVTGLRF